MSRPNGDFPPRMKGATGSVAGRRGLVPKPAASDNVKYLKGDGSWSALSNASAATNAEAAAGTSTTTFVTPANAQYAVANKTNALAPAQALSGNGTAGSTIANTQVFGTSDFSVAASVNVSAIGSVQVFLGGAANSFALSVDAAGYIYARKTGVANLATSSSPLTAGQTAVIAYTRSGTTGTYYINGVAVGTVTDSQDYSVACTQFGSTDGTQFFAGTLRLLGIANRALSAAEVLSVYQTGSFPASDFNSASNTATYTSDFSAGVDSWNVAFGLASVSGNIDGIGGLDNWLKYTSTALNALGIYRNTNLVAAAGKRYRYSFTVRHNSATVTSIKVYEYGNPTNAVTGIAVAPNTNVTVTVDLPNPSAAANYLIVQTEQAIANGELLYLRAFTSYPLGLYVAPSTKGGCGPQQRDMSGNNCPINLPGDGVDGGVAWTNPTDEGWFSYTRTSSGYLFGGWAIIPSGYYIAEMWISGNGVAAVTVGESAGTWTNVVASYVPAATPAPATLLVRTTSNRMLYLYLSASITCTVTVRIAKIG